MNPKLLPAFMLVALAVLGFACHKQAPITRNRMDELNFPTRIVWAWERPEDLEFLDPRQFGVAFLAQTLILKDDEVVFKPRRQALKVGPEMRLIAVTRIESLKITGTSTALSANQRSQLVDLVSKTLQLKNVSAIQIDFDVASSEREFYRALLHDLRQKLPDNIPLSMTALASFCVGDRWFKDLPVDEAVPMIFRMGSDDQAIKTFLEHGNDFREPLCRRSYGFAVDEPVAMQPKPSRRQYIFNVRAWTEDDLMPLRQTD